jgi:hypothetical protein
MARKARLTAMKMPESAAGGEGGSKAGDMSPLDYLLAILRDESVAPATRFDAAKAAAPYVHQRHQSLEHAGRDGGAIAVEAVSDRRLAMAVLRLLGGGVGMARDSAAAAGEADSARVEAKGSSAGAAEAGEDLSAGAAQASGDLSGGVAQACAAGPEAGAAGAAVR